MLKSHYPEALRAVERVKALLKKHGEQPYWPSLCSQRFIKVPNCSQHRSANSRMDRPKRNHEMADMMNGQAGKFDSMIVQRAVE